MKITGDKESTNHDQEAQHTDAWADKVAPVTGAAKGMGKAILLLYACEGARVAIAARGIEQRCAWRPRAAVPPWLWHST